jgi:hypothetical protein
MPPESYRIMLDEYNRMRIGTREAQGPDAT